MEFSPTSCWPPTINTRQLWERVQSQQREELVMHGNPAMLYLVMFAPSLVRWESVAVHELVQSFVRLLSGDVNVLIPHGFESQSSIGLKNKGESQGLMCWRL